MSGILTLRRLYDFCVAVVVSFFSIFHSLSAQEHLVPPAPIVYLPQEIAQYDDFVRMAFHDAFAGDALLGVVIEESFKEESVLYLKKNKGVVYLYHAKAEMVYSDNFKKIKKAQPVIKCSIPMKMDFVNDLDGIWRNELLNTRFTENTLNVMDGVKYSFFVNYKVDPDIMMGLKNAMIGEAYSPESGSKMGRLVRLVNELNNSCLENSLNSNVLNLVREFEVLHRQSK